MPIHRLTRASRAGAVLVLSLVAFFVLLLTLALVIDGGLIYGKRAEVAKAVDAAAIAGINNMSLGQGAAAQIARDMFLANYRMTPQDASAPDVDVQFQTDANGSTAVDIRATAHLRPLFLRVIPEFREFDVRASAQAVRAQLVMSLVLDRSGSMSGNGGCIALPPAVDTFVGFFNEATDRASLVTFGSNARVDVPMSRPFIGRIRAAVPRDCAIDYGGYTFFDGGLQLAGRENANVVIGPGEQIVKVVVFFTDGLANTFQDTFDCPPATTWNLTSGDTDAFATLLDPATGEFRCNAESGSFPCCPDLTTFPSVLGGTRHATGPEAATDVRQEAKDRARLRAKQIRTAGSIIYTIGLGNEIDQDFLREIANDPSSPAYDPSQPAGEFALAPTPADLQFVFQVIARKILVRISI